MLINNASDVTIDCDMTVEVEVAVVYERMWVVVFERLGGDDMFYRQKNGAWMSLS
jgi:hypothetical protein